GSLTSIVGALVGLALPTDAVQIALGATILAIAALMWRSPARGSEAPAGDALGAALRMNGIYHDAAVGRDVEWRVRRTPAAFVVFAGIGLLAGMFGLGAGWANVPAFNLLMGAPLKLAVGSSGLLLSVVDTSAAWVYLNRGAVLPLRDPTLPPRELVGLWLVPVDHHIAASGAPTGWGWLGLLHKSDYLIFLAVAMLGFITALCYARIIPVLFAQGEHWRAVIAVL